MHAAFENFADEVFVISAIGKGRIGTVGKDVENTPGWGGFNPDWYKTHVVEVVFKNSSESPERKLAKCKALGIQIFFDDRQDVCDLLNANGILAFKVPRKDNTTDLEGERI